jgi:hypothetical protein
VNFDVAAGQGPVGDEQLISNVVDAYPMTVLFATSVVALLPVARAIPSEARHQPVRNLL